MSSYCKATPKLIDADLFGNRDKVQVAIERLREFEPLAIKMHPDGYYVAFSGGKDSQVVLDLVQRAGVKFTAHWNICGGLDAPELLKFMRENYPPEVVERVRPKESAWQLMVRKKTPPTRIIRYCCEVLKEGGGVGRYVVTGVRWAESFKRSKRKMIETCRRGKPKTYLYPIIDWEESDVWSYLKSSGLKWCSLYDEGWKRVGCVGCPMTGKRRLEQFRRWPKIAKAWRDTFDKIIAARIASGTGHDYQSDKFAKWATGQDLWDWWMEENRSKEDTETCMMFE